MACPNSCRHTENTQPTRTKMKTSMLLGGDDDVVALALAQEQVAAEEQLGTGHGALGIGLAHVVDVDATLLDVLARLALGGGEAGVDEQVNEGHACAVELG